MTSEISSMQDAQTRTIILYQVTNDTVPFTEWFNSIKDTKVIDRIQARLDTLETGSFGKYRSVGDGVWELKLDIGPGYRIYYGQVDKTIVLLLCGGDKSSQNRDIEMAINYWKEYKERQNG